MECTKTINPNTPYNLVFFTLFSVYIRSSDPNLSDYVNMQRGNAINFARV